MPRKKTDTVTTTAEAPTTTAAVPPPTPPTPAEQPKTAAPDPRTFTATEQEFKPGKGLAAALYAEVKKAPGTAQQLAERLLASGEYQRTAPKAAELRPVRPVETFLKMWLAKGAVQAS